MLPTLEQLNSLIAEDVARKESEAEFEIVYTSPHLHDTPDDRLLFRRLEAVLAFPWAWPAGEC